MAGSYRAELLKLTKRPAMWVLGGAFVVLAQLFGYVLPYAAYRGPAGGGFAGTATPAQLLADLLPGRLVPNTLGGFPMFGGAIAVIIGALATGSEYGWGTVKTVLTQRATRPSVLGGKLLAMAVTVLSLVLAVFAVNALWAWGIASIEGRPAHWPAVLELVRGIGAGWLILGMWSAFGALLGMLLRSTSLAVGLGLVWALVIENLVRGFAGLLSVLDAVQKGLPGVNAGSLVAALGAVAQEEPGGTPGVALVVSGPRSVATLTGYVVVLALMAALVLSRQDVE